MSSITHPAKFLDCCAKLECNSSRLTHMFTNRQPSIFLPSKALTVTRVNIKPAAIPQPSVSVSIRVSLPKLPEVMSNYEMGDWKARVNTVFRMTKERKQQQEKLMNRLRFYLSIRGTIKAQTYINEKYVSIPTMPDGLYLYYILSALVRCPELMATNRDRILWAKCWTAVSPHDENVEALKNIHPILYENTVKRIDYYKKALKEYLTILETRSDYCV